MIRKLVSFCMISCLVLTSACGASSEEPKQEAAQNNEVVEEQSKETANEAPAEVEHQSIEVDENLLTVEITVPSSFIGDTTQEDIDKSVKENGYVSGTLNSDGSVTYKMTKAQHKELVAKIKETIDTQMSEMVGSEDYPNIVNVEANDNYTSFTITTKSTELGLMESMSTLAFYMYGGMYNAFAGEQVDNIHVDFVNEESGQVIQSADSKNMGSD